ncbi:MAG: cation transporting ATPase C-terminal domain-containing protein [Solirubrobacteraceae bacterium]
MWGAGLGCLASQAVISAGTSLGYASRSASPITACSTLRRGTALHHAYLRATTMTWAGIVACQMGAAFAVRTSRASLFQVGVLTNRHLLRGVAFALAFAAAIIYAPPIQSIFHTAPLPAHDLLVLACFPVIVWGSDELWRWHGRKRNGGSEPGSRHGERPSRSSSARGEDSAGRPSVGVDPAHLGSLSHP